MQKDFFHIPNKYSGDVKIYTQTTSVNLAGFQMWQKPKGASLVTMIAIAGAGGGGGGFTRAAGNAGGGGGSGASSGVARFICPAILLPDTLYIQVGAGGLGGAASTAGTAGLNSHILTLKTAVLPNLICYSGVNAPGAGGGGSATAGGIAGTIPTIAVTQPANTWGEWFAIAGQVGQVGGAQTGAVGAGPGSVWGTWVLSAGASGGGATASDFQGGNVTAANLLDVGNQGYYTTSSGNIARAGTPSGVGVHGSAGVNRITPFYCSGGAGGGTWNAGTAGDGGQGGYGCGGGGGGAGTTGGRGGNGGSGLVIIITI